MSVPPVDKIDEVPNNIWEVLFQGFPSPEILYILDILAMDEHAIMTKVKARSRVCVIEADSTMLAWRLCDPCDVGWTVVPWHHAAYPENECTSNISVKLCTHNLPCCTVATLSC